MGLPDSAGTAQAYRAVLERFWGVQQPLEAALARVAWGDLCERLGDRRRAHLILQDLRALGVPERRTAALPRLAIDGGWDAETALGVLYVLEGSTLGGRVIARELARRIGPAVEGATTFFDGRAAGAGPAWRGFLEVLNGALVSEAQQARAEAGARTAFAAMIDWFTPTIALDPATAAL